MSVFRIPYQAAESEFTEKRSRFISHVWPVDTEAEAQARIREMKAQYYDARHNCWCYRIGETTARYSDDGEPQGTAGQPMLKVLERENITNAVVVVTRYFGGILLGAGGLTRAYSKGAKDALSASGAATMGLWERWEIPCTYPLFERVKLEVESLDGMVDETEYAADITMRVSLMADKGNTLQDRLTELSAGSIRMKSLGSDYRPGPREDII